MKLPYQITLSALLPLASVAIISCSTITPETNIAAKIKPGMPGGEVVQTSTITAKVTGIDTAKRKVTLVTNDGKKLAVKAGPGVVNFEQIRIGDQLKVSLTEELVVRMAKPGEKTNDSETGVVQLSPVGAKPGGMMTETYQTAATVTSIDQANRKATLKMADGSSHTVAVRQDVDLTKRKVGEKVLIRKTEVLALLMEKP